MTSASPKTIRKFALQCGAGAQRLHDRVVRELHCSAIQVDEIWSYVRKKQARVTPEDPPEVGEAYTFVAIDANSRLVVSFLVGRRDEASTQAFIRDLRSRLVVMPAMTSDGFAPYISAIGRNFGASIDYAQCKKNYTQQGRRDDDHRYEPPRNPFIEKRAVYGAPDLEKASTSYVERQNLTMRHQIGRMRRLCLAFSKKIENHRAAVSLNYCHYNFCNVIKTLRVTPAMQAGLTDHIWSLEEFMDVILKEQEGPKPTPKPLAVRLPEGPARELPGGRGFLRLVPGGRERPG